MLYDVKLRIRYAYASPAAMGRHVVRLLPADLPGVQRLIAGHIDITPAPAERRDSRDFFGNSVTEFAFRAPHDTITLALHARIDRQAPPADTRPATALCDLPAELAACRDLGPQSAVHFLAASPRVPQDAAMTAYARAALPASPSVAEAVIAIGRALHRDMRYDPTATDVETPAAEAFAKRHGVCQDFSHVMIACLRGLGIPAGYVSGFLRTLPPPGQPRLEGADAMHAWVRAWCGGASGWLDYDPTNAAIAGADHITVAQGRDYFDVAPVKGVLRVAGGQTSTQAVDVIPLAESPA